MSPWIAAIDMGISGALAGIAAEVAFYGLDSYKILKQAGDPVKVSRLFRGAIPVATVGSGPSFGIFFLAYHPLRHYLLELGGNNVNSTNVSSTEGFAVLAASLLSAVPSSIVAVPADVLKKQIILRATNSNAHKRQGVVAVARDLLREGGVRRLFLGWHINLIRDVPFAGIKMTFYELIARAYLRLKLETCAVGSDLPLNDTGGSTTTTTTTTARVPTTNSSSSCSISSNNKNRNTGQQINSRLTRKHEVDSKETAYLVSSDDLTSMEAAGVGFISGICTAVLTCPIDVVNTRIKSGELANYGVISAHAEIIRRHGISALFRGLIPRAAILGLGSTVFWYLQASIMHLLPVLSNR